MEHPSKTADKGLKSLNTPRNISELSSRSDDDILRQDAQRTQRALNQGRQHPSKTPDQGIQPQQSGWSR